MTSHQVPFIVIDPVAVWQNMSIGAFGTKLAVAFGKIFAHIVVRACEIVTEWARVSSLASALPEEFAGYVRSIYDIVSLESSCRGLPFGFSIGCLELRSRDRLGVLPY